MGPVRYIFQLTFFTGEYTKHISLPVYLHQSPFLSKMKFLLHNSSSHFSLNGDVSFLQKKKKAYYQCHICTRIFTHTHISVEEKLGVELLDCSIGGRCSLL